MHPHRDVDPRVAALEADKVILTDQVRCFERRIEELMNVKREARTSRMRKQAGWLVIQAGLSVLLYLIFVGIATNGKMEPDPWGHTWLWGSVLTINTIIAGVRLVKSSK